MTWRKDANNRHSSQMLTSFIEFCSILAIKITNAKNLLVTSDWSKRQIFCSRAEAFGNRGRNLNSSICRFGTRFLTLQSEELDSPWDWERRRNLSGCWESRLSWNCPSLFHWFGHWDAPDLSYLQPEQLFDGRVTVSYESSGEMWLTLVCMQSGPGKEPCGEISGSNCCSTSGWIQLVCLVSWLMKKTFWSRVTCRSQWDGNCEA